jgi:hypothetical protein
MSQLTVIDHHLDEFLDVYRLTVGYASQVRVPVLDANGEQVFSPDEIKRVPKIKTGKDGKTFEDPNDFTEHVTPGKAMTQSATVFDAIEEFVFARHDERYEGKNPIEIAQDQRRSVRAALKRRERALQSQAAAAPDLVAMPGINEKL